MNPELLIGIGLLVLGSVIIMYVAIARDHPLVYLSGLGVAAMGAASAVIGTMSPGPARIGVSSLFYIVACSAFLVQWRMARRLQSPGGATADQEPGAG